MRWEATSQDVIDHIVFSGADEYDWYVELYVDGEMIVCTMEDPDDSESVVSNQISAASLRLLVDKFVLDQRGGYKHVLRAIKDDDFDCNDADIVLQWWLLGEVVYG